VTYVTLSEEYFRYSEGGIKYNRKLLWEYIYIIDAVFIKPRVKSCAYALVMRVYLLCERIVNERLSTRLIHK
jgi:hypothetical protein